MRPCGKNHADCVNRCKHPECMVVYNAYVRDRTAGKRRRQYTSDIIDTIAEILCDR